MAAQSSTAALVPGAHIRVWFRPYRLSAQAGTVQSLRGDTLRFRVAGFRDVASGAADDFEINLPMLDSLEVSAGRSNVAAVRGAIKGAVAGGLVGGISAGFTGADDGSAVGYATVRAFVAAGAIIGAVVGGIQAQGKAEKWAAIPLRRRPQR